MPIAVAPLQKRPNDLFVSYGHADQARIDPIVDWLRRSAGLKVWYDKVSGDASKRSTDLLAEGIQSARGSLFFLSSSWTDSTWCKDEHEVAQTERRSNDAYLVVATRIDDVEIPAWFRTAEVVDFRKFQATSAADLLRSLVSHPPTRFDNTQDVYFAGPWSRPSNAAKATLGKLHEMGWRLVGDSPNSPQFKDSTQRITSIIGTARGLVAVLPFDKAKPPHYTSPWIVEEVRIAQGCGRPYFLLAETGVQVPPELVADAFGGQVVSLSGEGPDASLQPILLDFDDALTRHPPSDARAYSFLATSLLGDQQDSDNMVSVVEHASNMTCVRGQGLTGQHVQQAIIDRIRNAAFVIADVTDDKRNSLIEAGVALGAGTPLHLLCQLPSDGSLKQRFMFQDMEMNWYASPLERLGVMYRIARMYNRRVLAFR